MLQSCKDVVSLEIFCSRQTCESLQCSQAGRGFVTLVALWAERGEVSHPLRVNGLHERGTESTDTRLDPAHAGASTCHRWLLVSHRQVADVALQFRQVGAIACKSAAAGPKPPCCRPTGLRGTDVAIPQARRYAPDQSSYGACSGQSLLGPQERHTRLSRLLCAGLLLF